MNEPLVSVGVPLYNAEVKLSAALDSLINQSYTNIEIIISDNASRDGTWNICQAFAARDSRIKLHRNETNIGAIANFHRVFELSRGKYFLWAAYDDSRDESYISECVEKLESHPEAVLCYSNQRFVEAKEGAETILQYSIDGEDKLFWRRIGQLLAYKPTPYSLIYGVFRRETIEPLIPMPKSPIFDIHFLLQVAQRGTLIHVPKLLFTKGVHIKQFHARMSMIDPKYAHLPAFLVYSIMFLHLLSFSWSAGNTIESKAYLITASAKYSLPRIVTHLVPVSWRRWLRMRAKHNSVLNRILHPFLSTKPGAE